MFFKMCDKYIVNYVYLNMFDNLNTLTPGYIAPSFIVLSHSVCVSTENNIDLFSTKFLSNIICEYLSIYIYIKF